MVFVGSIFKFDLVTFIIMDDLFSINSTPQDVTLGRNNVKVANKIYQVYAFLFCGIFEDLIHIQIFE